MWIEGLKHRSWHVLSVVRSQLIDCNELSCWTCTFCVCESSHVDLTIHLCPDALSSPGSAFSLMVEVSDALTRQPLSRADVQVYINHSVASTAQTGQSGAALLHVPYQPEAPVTLVASKNGYVRTVLPYRSSRMPSKMRRLNHQHRLEVTLRLSE